MNEIKSKENQRKVKCFIASCYGKAKTTIKKGIITQVCGQNFWFMISGKPDFYTDIIKPIGHKAKERNEEFLGEKAKIINMFTKQFIVDFCDRNGQVNWGKLVRFNSGNLKS